MSESYLIPAKRYRTSQTIKRSRFIATVAHTADPNAAKAFIAEIKTEFNDASHNCWAYLAGPPGDTARIGMNDDGEVRQTAGRPMLNVLLHSGVGEVAAVVTRYYGGTNLGTGGLVRAYAGTLKMALDEMKQAETLLVPKRELIRLQLKFAYPHLNEIQALLHRFQARTVARHWTQAVDLTIAVSVEKKAALIAGLMNLTAGEIRILPLEAD